MRIILSALIILTTAAALWIIVAANERGVRKYYAPEDDADSTAPRVDVSTLLVAVFATALFLAAVVIPAGAHSLAQVLG